MEKSKEIAGIRIFWTETGSPGGQPVVLMHGWGCSAATVRSVAQVCESAGCRVMAVDLPGFGRSQEPPEVWGTARYTDAVMALCDSEGITAPILIGHSFGGRLAITWASRRPEGVKAVVLVDAAGVKPRRTARYYLRVWTFKAWKRLLPLAVGRRQAETLLEERRRRTASADYLAASPGMRAVLSKVVNEDLCALMPAIKAPTLMIWGDDDTATPLADARRMESLIEGSATVSFAGAGHYSFLDQPARFAAVLLSFLNSTIHESRPKKR